MNTYSVHTLDNGLQVALVPMEGTNSVTALILFKVGSEYETRKTNGLSHFVEHMIFKGTKKRPTETLIAAEIDSVGGIQNAFTAEALTGYFVKLPSKHLERALDVVSDMLLNSLFDENELEIEKGPVKEEIKGILGNPSAHLEVVWKTLLFGDQPAGWDVAGTPELVDSFTRKDLIKHVKRAYGARNTVLVVAGNIDVGEAERLSEEYFGGLAKGKNLGDPPFSDNQTEPAIKIEKKDIQQVHLGLGFKAFDMFDPRRYALRLLVAALGGGMSSRLFEKVRGKRGLVYSIHGGIDVSLKHGQTWVSAALSPENLLEAIQVILDEHKAILQDMRHDELDKVKEMINGQRELGFEDSRRLAEFYGGELILRGEIITPRQVAERFEHVTLDELKQVGDEVFRPKNLNLALLGPVKKGKALEKIIREFV